MCQMNDDFGKENEKQINNDGLNIIFTSVLRTRKKQRDI